MGERSNKPKDDLIGKTLGQYEIIEEVGRGGMATVYRARQLSMNRIVAVKVLPRNLLHDPSFSERFEREVEVISQLEHPHILPIYDYSAAAEVPFIAMRYLGGGSLLDLIRRGPTKLAELDRPFGQIAQALDYAHKQGIIHRDIKPGNVMLDENGNAYLSDFGIARVLGSNLTGSAIIGTPAYMSPEQANGLPLDARSDIYALGVVLFELVTGREPFQAETPMAMLLKHITEPLPPVREFRADAPLGIENVIAKATAKDPKERYTSADEMANEFSEAVRGVHPTPKSFGREPEDTPTIIPAPGSSPRLTPAPMAKTGQTPGVTPPTAMPVITESLNPPASASRTPLIIGVVALVVVAAIVGAVALPALTQKPVVTVMVAATLAAPTPFHDAKLVEDKTYSIIIPGDWSKKTELSDKDRLVHVWQADDNSAYASLALAQTDVSSQNQFESAIDAYNKRYYAPQTHLAAVDEAAAPDGTVRYSYRLDGKGGQPVFAAGQLDVFFMQRGAYLAVLELYSADSTGNKLVPTFQSILDSLRVKTEIAAK